MNRASIALFVTMAVGAAPVLRAQVTQPAESSAQAVQSNLRPEQFNRAIATGDYQLIDVRTPKEFSAGHIAGAVNIDWTAADYEAAFSRIDPAKPLLLYCHAGGRSEQALEYLVDKGYHVQHLEGGISAWRKASMAEVR